MVPAVDGLSDQDTGDDGRTRPSEPERDDLSSAAEERQTGEADPLAAVDWSDLVARIQSSNSSGMEDLYRMFSRGVRFFLCRHLGHQELEDKVHDTFLIVVQAIRRGDLREPARLMGFIRTVVRRQVAAYIDQAVQSRRESTDLEQTGRLADLARNPEQAAMLQQNVDLALQILRSISRRDREILTRFYLLEETQEQICHEMDLSETQFRLLKSRAKARFGQLGRRKIQRSGLPAFLLRKSHSASH